MVTALIVILVFLASQSLMSAQGNPVDMEATREFVEKLCTGEATGERLNEQLVISVATKLNQDLAMNCEDHVREGFKDLGNIIRETRRNGCSRESVEAIIKFLPDSPKVNQFWQTLPREMYVFAIDYAMGMSKHCKKVMAKVLLNNKQLEERDFVALEGWTKKDSYVDQLLNRMTNIGVVSPSDVEAVIPDENTLFRAINIDPASEPESVKIIKAVCSKRFKPVYGSVVAPVHLLLRAGIDYPDENIMEGMREEEREQIKLWSKIVLLCDTADLEQSFNHEHSGPTEPKEIEFVSGQSIRWNDDGSNGGRELAANDEDESEFEQIEYEPVVQEGMGDVEQIAESEIEQLIREMIDKRGDPITRLKGKFVDSVLGLAMEILEHGDIHRLIRCVRHDDLFPNNHAQKPSKELKKEHQDCEWPKSTKKEPLGALFGGVLAVAVGALEELGSDIAAYQIDLGLE